MNQYSQLKFIDRDNHTHILRCDYFYKNDLFIVNYFVTLCDEKKLTPDDMYYLLLRLQAFVKKEKELYQER